MSSTRHRIISFILILSFLTSLAVVPTILATEIEEDTYERVAETGLFDLKSLSAPASIYTTQTQTSPLDVNLSNVTCMACLLEDETGVTRTFSLDDIEFTTKDVPKSGVLANFEDNYVDIWFGTKNMTANKTSKISYSEPYSMNISYTKLPCEESWNQSFGFGFPSSLRNISNYSAISMRVYGSCSIGACLGTGDSEVCVYLGTRSSTEPDTWNQLVWDLHAHDVNLSNAIGITFLLEDETGVTRTFSLDDVEFTTKDVPKSGVLANFEDNYVDIWFGTKNMTANKTSKISYSEPYSMNISYTKLPCEESWNQSFGFRLPSSLRDISNYSALSIRVNGSCSISACIGTSDSEECVYLGTRSSMEPDTWNQLIWDLHAHDINLSNATCMAFLLEDETGVTRTFFLDDIELTTAAIYVPDDYPTIQDAVNAASDGDTIIVRDGTYTENINVDKRLTIQSERDSTIVKAANPDDHIFEVTADYVNLSGFTVKGTGTCYCAGIYLGEVTHCNIFNNKASNNFIGIYVNGSSYSVLTNNIVHNNYGFGICLSSSNNNVLASNSANNNSEGIYLYTSSNNTLTDNTMSGNDFNFVVLGWFFSHFIQNIDTSNKVNDKPIYYWIDKQNQQIPNDAGYVGIINSTNITVKDLTLTNNGQGVLFVYTSNSRIENVTASNNYYGIWLHDSSSNTLTNNTMSGNEYNFVILGWSFGDFIQNIDTSNKVNGKPIYYWVDKQNQQIPNNAGYVGIVNSTNITVKDLTLTNNGQGVLFAYTSNSRIENVTASNNYHGICLEDSSSNILTNNSADNNEGFGILLDDSSDNTLTNNNVYNNLQRGIYLEDSSNNLIYHNNLIDSGNQAYDNTGTNLWNKRYPIGGNYWDDYLGSDVYSGPDQNVPGSDRIGDTPYGISGDASAQDRYPFMNKDGGLTKPVFGVELSTSADALSTAQSENATYLLTIRNTGTVRDNYTLLLENADNADVAASSTYYINNLAAGASTTVLLNVTDAMADSYRVSVKASSEGDFTKSATIDTTTTVIIVIIGDTKLPSIITISVTPNLINRGESITISGSIIPASSAIITLTFTTPTGSVLEQTTTSTISGTYRFVFPTNKEGVWFVNATWAGDINHLGDTSKTVSFTVNKTEINVGYAVIITGRHDDNRAQSSIDLTVNKVYRILTEERGFTHESIFYLNPRMDHDANDDEVYDVDRISSLRNVSYAINTWAKNNVSVDVPLLLYMVDHGGTDAFLVNGANHTLTALDLNNYLDQLTDATGCHNITVVIDACICGSFIDDLSRTGRIVVTSTGIDADAFINKIGAHFSLDFFRSISNGKTIKEAFEDASNNLYLKKYFPEITPMLDDNGDKRGHTAPLPNAGDGLLAASKYIGIQGSTLNFPPTIIGAIPSQEVVVNTNVTIWAVVVDDSPIEDVYANIIEPNWSPSPVNDTLFEINLTTLQLEDTDGDGNYTARFTPTVLGNYTVILHATDERGNPASPKQRIITAVPPPESAYTAQEHILAPLAHTTKRSRQIEGY